MMQSITKSIPTTMVAIWRVFVDHRFSTGACRVLLAVTLSPPSRTCMRMRVMSIIHVIIRYGVIKKRNSIDRVYRKLRFLQLFLHFFDKCERIEV